MNSMETWGEYKLKEEAKIEQNIFNLEQSNKREREKRIKKIPGSLNLFKIDHIKDPEYKKERLNNVLNSKIVEPFCNFATWILERGNG